MKSSKGQPQKAKSGYKRRDFLKLDQMIRGIPEKRRRDSLEGFWGDCEGIFG